MTHGTDKLVVRSNTMWNGPESGPDSAPVAQPPTFIPTSSPVEVKPARTAPRSVQAIGSSVIVKGDLTAEEDLTVDGRVEGRIDLHGHALTIGPNARIEATISARMVTVFGAVTGTMVVHEKLDIRLGARIEGEVTCARLSIQDGAVVTGKVTTEGRGPARNDAAVEAPPTVDSESVAIASSV
jgi:cytoskeletal protein CcmA (bactofilin family)